VESRAAHNHVDTYVTPQRHWDYGDNECMFYSNHGNKTATVFKVVPYLAPTSLVTIAILCADALSVPRQITNKLTHQPPNS
jgi:hypothetical protein